VKYAGWRAAFVVPALIALGCGIAFARIAPQETAAPAAASRRPDVHSRAVLARVFAVMTVAAISSSLLFNFTTNGNGQLLRERLAGIVDDPALLGALLACVYLVASFAQVAVGLLIDRFTLKRLYLTIVAIQIPLFALAAFATGWALFGLQIAFMVFVFGAIPFTDAMIVRYVDDRMRSRVSGMRLAVSFGVSSAAVWLLGPVVKASGFGTLLLAMAGIAAVTLAAIVWLPATAPAVRLALSPGSAPTADSPAGED
jgi:predicted MFS family arabinose efflux permease